MRTTEVCVCVCCVGWLFSGGVRLGRGLSWTRQFVTSFRPTHQANTWIVSQFIHDHWLSNAFHWQLHVKLLITVSNQSKTPTLLCSELISCNLQIQICCNPEPWSYRHNGNVGRSRFHTPYVFVLYYQNIQVFIIWCIYYVAYSTCMFLWLTVLFREGI